MFFSVTMTHFILTSYPNIAQGERKLIPNLVAKTKVSKVIDFRYFFYYEQDNIRNYEIEQGTSTYLIVLIAYVHSSQLEHSKSQLIIYHQFTGM